MFPITATDSANVATKPVHWNKFQFPEGVLFLIQVRINIATGNNKNSPNIADRVPVINIVVILNAIDNVIKKTDGLLCNRVRSNIENGNAQTANSAKKFLLTNVDAGFGPWANH